MIVQQPPFDLKRHFREMFRIFLPIFVLVAAAGIIIWAILAPGERPETWTAGPETERVGLHSADPEVEFDPTFALVRPIEKARAPRAGRFDMPMGSALGSMTYNAQPFLTSRHLGDDLNGIGGQDSDQGDPVYAVADGEVIYAGWPADGWGNVVMLLHKLPDGRNVESLYGHLEKVRVTAGTEVRRGRRIGAVGKGDGRYLAHLHFELQTQGTLDPGRGYADAALGRLPGERSLTGWRGAPENLQNEVIEAPEPEREWPAMRFSAGEK